MVEACVPLCLDVIVGVGVSACVAEGKGRVGLLGLHLRLGIDWVGVEDEGLFG